MKVKHACGCIVDVIVRYAPFVERTFCYECEQLARKLQNEQHERFEDALKEEGI